MVWATFRQYCREVLVQKSGPKPLLLNSAKAVLDIYKANSHANWHEAALGSGLATLPNPIIDQSVLVISWAFWFMNFWGRFGNVAKPLLRGLANRFWQHCRKRFPWDRVFRILKTFLASICCLPLKKGQGAFSVFLHCNFWRIFGAIIYIRRSV